MKTILVVYSSDPQNDERIFQKKRYSFNTEADLKVRDIINTLQYDSALVVVMVLSESHKYFNIQTGEMSNTFNSSSQYEIRTLIIEDKLTSRDDAISGVLVNRKLDAKENKPVKITL